jgi:hypothetical protein
MPESRRALRERTATLIDAPSSPAARPAPAAPSLGGAAAPPSAPLPPPPPPSSSSGTLLGVEPGHPQLRSAEPKPPLGRGGWPLPTLTARQQRPRGWWAHPAFIVSAVLTFLSMVGMATWMIVSALTSTDVVVTGLTVTDAEGTAHIDWEGPDAAYSLYAVHGDGEVVDLSTWIRGGTDAWLPMSADLFDAETCFVVREAGLDPAVTLDADDLAAQGGQSACMADARVDG